MTANTLQGCMARPLHAPRVSINSLMDFINASDCKKASIVRAQQKPRTIVVAPYCTARAAIKKSVQENDMSCIMGAISRLQQRVCDSQWKRNDTANSIMVLRKFISSTFPQRLGKISCSFHKPAIKECYIDGVAITVAPDLIMRWQYEGKNYIGAVKFRISKSQFDYLTGSCAASLVQYYLRNAVAREGEIVDNSFCMFFDIISDRIFTAPFDDTTAMNTLHSTCSEYRQLWEAA